MKDTNQPSTAYSNPHSKIKSLAVAVAFVQAFAVLVLPALFVTMLPSCGPGTLTGTWSDDDIGDLIQGHREKKHAPPESMWNAVGVWKKVSQNPATYIPTGYPTGAPRGNANGNWFEDKRDGKRLFVPTQGVDRLSKQILTKDAHKTITPTPGTPTLGKEAHPIKDFLDMLRTAKQS
jgi:hypothetical protein